MKFSATLHLLSRKTSTTTSNPRVEWAYGKYDHPDVGLRAGRLALPGFCAVGLSERRLLDDAGARPGGSLRPAADFAFNGVDALWRTQANPLALTVQPFAGRSNIHARFSDPQATRAEGDATVYGMNLVGQWDDWSLRIARH